VTRQESRFAAGREREGAGKTGRDIKTGVYRVSVSWWPRGSGRRGSRYPSTATASARAETWIQPTTSSTRSPGTSLTVASLTLGDNVPNDLIPMVELHRVVQARRDLKRVTQDAESRRPIEPGPEVVGHLLHQLVSKVAELNLEEGAAVYVCERRRLSIDIAVHDPVGNRAESLALTLALLREFFRFERIDEFGHLLDSRGRGGPGRLRGGTAKARSTCSRWFR
jgi:hypothetical protein